MQRTARDGMKSCEFAEGFAMCIEKQIAGRNEIKECVSGVKK